MTATRRSVLGALAGAAAFGAGLASRCGHAAEGPPRRIVSLDYALAETLVALGAPPLAVAAAADWPTWVVEPALPAGTVDVGGSLEPNLELVAALSPDLILASPYVASVAPLLAPIAPVEVHAIYGTDDRPLDRARAVTTALAARLARPEAAVAVLAEAERLFDGYAARVARLAPPPIAVLAFQDARHARVFGGVGLYQNVMDRIGLANAWNGAANAWGFGTAAVEDLAGLDPLLHVLTIEPVPPDAARTLARSPLWTSLPFVRAGRVSVVPPSLMFGAVPSALRFARLAVEALEARGA